MNPSEQVTLVCEILGLGCRPSQDVDEESWKEWLNAFQGIRVPIICPKCGKSVVEKHGKYGKFWGCSGYPSCRYTQKSI